MDKLLNSRFRKLPLVLFFICFLLYNLFYFEKTYYAKSFSGFPWLNDLPFNIEKWVVGIVKWIIGGFIVFASSFLLIKKKPFKNPVVNLIFVLFITFIFWIFGMVALLHWGGFAIFLALFLLSNKLSFKCPSFYPIFVAILMGFTNWLLFVYWILHSARTSPDPGLLVAIGLFLSLFLFLLSTSIAALIGSIIFYRKFKTRLSLITIYFSVIILFVPILILIIMKLK